jgi:hypothetical protein
VFGAKLARIATGDLFVGVYRENGSTNGKRSWRLGACCAHKTKDCQGKEGDLSLTA